MTKRTATGKPAVTKDAVVSGIAASIGFETLEERRMDSLDFREVGVLQIKDALEAAYEAGRKAAAK